MGLVSIRDLNTILTGLSSCIVAKCQIDMFQLNEIWGRHSSSFQKVLKLHQVPVLREAELKRLNPNKASGPDNLSPHST